MAENVHETKPPEPPPKPPEVPKPTEQPNRSEAKDHDQPNESQQSAQQDARNAVQSEHAKATEVPDPDGLRPTPESQARLTAHSAAKNGPEGLQPTPEFQERLNGHTAERNAAAPQDSAGAQGPQDSGAIQRPQVAGNAPRSQDSTTSRAESNPQRPQDSVDNRNATPAVDDDGYATAPAGDGGRYAQPSAGEQADELAAVRKAAAAERSEAAEDVTILGEGGRPQSVQDLNSQPDPLPETTPPPLDNVQDPPPLGEPPEAPLPDAPDPLTTPPPGESPTADQSSETVDKNNEPVAEHELDLDQNATDGEEAAGAAQPENQDAQRQATKSPEEMLAGNGPKDATSARVQADQRDTKAVLSIAEEIASSPVDVRAKPHVNSAGDTVDRNIVDDADDLLPLAEHLGIGELSHDKYDYYSGQLPDGRYRKIEWNLDGHFETNEGPHVKVMETEDPWSPPAKGNRWKAKAMIFVEGHENYKKQWH